MVPRVVAEIESASTLTAVIADGLGATILPASMAREMVASSATPGSAASSSRCIEAPLALCQSDHLPLSEPAQAVKEILLELVAAPARQPAQPARTTSHAAVIRRPYRGTAIPSWRRRHPPIPLRCGRSRLTCRAGQGAWTSSRSRHSSTRWRRRTSPRWSSARTAGRCAWCDGLRLRQRRRAANRRSRDRRSRPARPNCRYAGRGRGIE